VGLGAGIAMGAQMMNNMSGVAAAGASAGAGAAPPPIPGAVLYHVAQGQSQTGPFDLAALQQQVNAGQVNRNTLVWKAGMAQWAKAGELPDLAPLFSNVPPPVPT